MKPKPTNRVSDNGAPPTAAATLYDGSVMHHRMKPKEHRFSYSVFSVLLDIDRLRDAAGLSWLFSVNKFNLLSFHEKDHGPRDGGNLRKHVESLLHEQGLEAPARILLLAYPRLLGYGFNPLSVYYAYDDENRLTALIYEVRNTFGGLHTYVAPGCPDQFTYAGIPPAHRKLFYVSPFISMDQHYHFRMVPPAHAVRLRSFATDPAPPLLAPTLSGDP